MTKASVTERKWPMPLRVLLARPRLLLSILVGLAIVAVLPLYAEQFRGVTRILVGWDIGVALYLALAFWMIAKSEFVQIHRQSLAEDEGSFAILVLTIVSAAASVGAVFAWFEFATHAETFTPAGLIFMLVTIMLSWTFTHTMFALHSAHEYYAEHGKRSLLRSSHEKKCKGDQHN